MIVEERIYTLHPGQLAFYIASYEAEGMPIQKRILGRMVGCYTTEFGPLNQVIHIGAMRASPSAPSAAPPSSRTRAGWTTSRRCAPASPRRKASCSSRRPS
jgi:hypothetical protein